MPAPTALQRKPDLLANDTAEDTLQMQGETLPDTRIEILDGSMTISGQELVDRPEALEASMQIDAEGRPHFDPSSESSSPTSALKVQKRTIPVPPHRFNSFKASWNKIYPPLVEHLKLQVRMNIKSKCIELRTSKFTTEAGALQMGEDFVKAIALGFDVDDAIALIRVQDLYIETFEVKDVKNLQGEHLSRAIGRIAGAQGKTKFAIENTSRTRIVLADSKITILGGFSNIHIARTAVVSLILGAPPGKVYGNLRTVASRMKERF